jgi:hypothetical protein
MGGGAVSGRHAEHGRFGSRLFAAAALAAAAAAVAGVLLVLGGVL